jgi:hypothetical protein
MEGNVMHQMQVTVRYRVEADHVHFRAEMAKSAPAIASIPGLVRNMWSLDPDSGLGTSIYLFEDEVAARHFLAGPTLEHLLNGSNASGLSFDLAHVEGAEQGATAASIRADARIDGRFQGAPRQA